MITQKDYERIKEKLQKAKTRIQFRNAEKADSLGYEGYCNCQLRKKI
ncbi:tetrahydromethanopterin S-methyltransferase subunit G [Borreliella bavariensis]|nr:tetrahydromethanopterin S-methyltransferase subunit G [Borreliella bavariensis]